MKILDAGYIRLEKRCIRCGKIIHTTIPNNRLFWFWGMYPDWRCLYCGAREEMMSHDFGLLNEALRRVYKSLRAETQVWPSICREL